MGYGTRAISLLFKYYNGELMTVADDVSDTESDDNSTIDKERNVNNGDIVPRNDVPPLLVPCDQVNEIPRLDWLGTSCGLTSELNKFWCLRAGMKLLYLRQTVNDVTGEHSAIFVKSIPKKSGNNLCKIFLFVLKRHGSQSFFQNPA